MIPRLLTILTIASLSMAPALSRAYQVQTNSLGTATLSDKRVSFETASCRWQNAHSIEPTYALDSPTCIVENVNLGEGVIQVVSNSRMVASNEYSTVHVFSKSGPEGNRITIFATPSRLRQTVSYNTPEISTPEAESILRQVFGERIELTVRVLETRE